MKCMMSSDGTNIIRVSDDEASKLYHNENFKYVSKAIWKEKSQQSGVKTNDWHTYRCMHRYFSYHGALSG